MPCRCSLALTLFVLSASAAGFAQEPKLPKPGYAKKLASIKVEKPEAEGADFEIAVIPDLYLYEMAKGFEELAKSGYTGDRLQKELEKLHKDAKKKQGFYGLRVRMERTRSDVQFFLQNKVEKHCDTSKEVKIRDVEDIKPEPQYLTWTLFAGASTRKMKLAAVDELSFLVEIDPKKAGEPFEFEITDLVRFKEPVKKSEYDRRGINKGARQVMVAHFENLAFPKITTKFYPAKWKLPKPPEGFQELIDSLQ